MMPIPPELVTQIRQHKGVLFVGAGLSQEAGLPSWSSLLYDILSWAVRHGIELSPSEVSELKDYIEHGDFLLVAEELRQRLGKDRFRRYLTETISRHDLKPTETHTLLTGIPFAAVLTSNYDTFLETSYTLVQGRSPSVFTHAETPELIAIQREGEFYILKIHGTVDRIDTIVLGRDDYREIMFMKPAYRQCLANVLLLHTVLFIGFSLLDPDWLLLLDQIQKLAQGYAGSHYALMDVSHMGPIKRNRYAKDYGIQVVPYIATGSDHSQVRAFLRQLTSEVNNGFSAGVRVPDFFTKAEHP